MGIEPKQPLYQAWKVQAIRKQDNKGHECTDFDYKQVAKISNPVRMSEYSANMANERAHQTLVMYYLVEEPKEPTTETPKA